MKLLKHILLACGLLVTWAGISQTTLKGYITQYEHGDSVIDCKVYNRTLVLNENGEEIKKEWLSLSYEEPEADPTVHFTFKIKESDNYVNGWENTTAMQSFGYIHDTLNHRYYILDNEDTSMVYETVYDDQQRMIEQKCLFGCTYTNYYSYANPLVDTLITVWENGKKDYTIYEYDEDGRPLLTKLGLKALDDDTYSYVKVKYKDQVGMTIEEYGNTASDHKEVVTKFKDKKGLPVYETYEYYQGEDKVRWVIEYEVD